MTLRKILLVLIVLALSACLSSCGRAHAQTQSVWMFHTTGYDAQGRPFFEVGTVTYDETGGHCTDSLMNTLGVGPHKVHECIAAGDPGEGGTGVTSTDGTLRWALNNSTDGIWFLEARKQ